MYILQNSELREFLVACSNRKIRTYLKNDPMPIFGGDFQRFFGHNLLALTQRHDMKVVGHGRKVQFCAQFFNFLCICGSEDSILVGKREKYLDLRSKD